MTNQRNVESFSVTWADLLVRLALDAARRLKPRRGPSARLMAMVVLFSHLTAADQRRLLQWAWRDLPRVRRGDKALRFARRFAFPKQSFATEPLTGAKLGARVRFAKHALELPAREMPRYYARVAGPEAARRCFRDRHRRRRQDAA